jgi:hypothetical protein
LGSWHRRGEGNVPSGWRRTGGWEVRIGGRGKLPERVAADGRSGSSHRWARETSRARGGGTDRWEVHIGGARETSQAGLRSQVLRALHRGMYLVGPVQSAETRAMAAVLKSP